MTARKQSQERKKAKPKKKAAAKRKAPTKKSQARKGPPPAKKGTTRKGTGRTLDRRIYAEARGRGASKAEAARLAGSTGRTVASRTQAGTLVEADPQIADLIEAIKADILLREIKDPWEKSQAVMKAMLHHPEWRARGTASNFFGKVVGGYAPEKVEHSGSIETTPAGEIGKLSKEEREKIRKLLGKRSS